MTLANPITLAQIVSFGVFVWVGLYLLVRAEQHTPLILVSLLALFAQAVFFGGLGALASAIPDTNTATLVHRALWWSAVVPIAAWFHGSSLIARQTLDTRAPPPPTGLLVAWLGQPRLVLTVYALAVVLSVLGGSTNLINNYHDLTVAASGEWAPRSGTLYPIYMVYNVVVISGALVQFGLTLRRLNRQRTPGYRPLVRQLQLLTGGGVLFLFSALWLTSTYAWDLGLSVLPAYFCLLCGLALIASSIAVYGLLLTGQDIQRDFIYNLTAISLTNVLYAGLLASLGALTVPTALLLVSLVTLTHTAFDNGRSILDRFFFSPAERSARADARNYATILGTAPVAAPTRPARPDDTPDDTPDNAPEPTLRLDIPPVSKQFQDMVRRAITNLKNPPQLARSPLLTLALVDQQLAQGSQDDNRLNRAAALRELLISQIDNLQPTDTATAQTGDAWRFYNVLYYPYVREISRKGAVREARRLADARRRSGQETPGDLETVLIWLANIDENTFYKWQRRASDTLATIVWEENQKLTLPESDGATAPGPTRPH